MALIGEAQQRFLDAIAHFERAAGKLLEKQVKAEEVAQQLRALQAGQAKLESENRALRARNREISERLERAIAGLRETLNA